MPVHSAHKNRPIAHENKASREKRPPTWRREERHALGAEPCVSISYARAGNGDGDSPTSAQPNRPRRTSKPSPLWGISRAAPREKELSVRGVMCARTVHATHASHVLVVVVVSSPSSCSSSSSSRLSLFSLSLIAAVLHTYGTPLVNVTTSGALAALPRPLNRFQRRPIESAATPSAAPLMDE